MPPPDRKPPPNYALIWPQQGGRASVGAGASHVNFVTGDVNPATGNPDKLSTYLQAVGLTEVQSVLIEADQDVVVQFDGGAKYTIDGGEISRVTYTSIRNIVIITTQTTLLRVWGSTHPEGVPEKFSSSIVGGKVTTTAGASVGRPFTRMTRGSVLAATYQNIASYTIPGAGTKASIREIALDASTIGSVRWKLTIAGEQQFRGLVLVTPYAIPYPDNTLKAGSVILVQAQSLGGTYRAVAGISGVKF